MTVFNGSFKCPLRSHFCRLALRCFMETDDQRKSIRQLRTDRDRLETLYTTSGGQLPDRGANLRRRIEDIEALIRTKRQERAKVETANCPTDPELEFSETHNSEQSNARSLVELQNDKE